MTIHKILILILIAAGSSGITRAQVQPDAGVQNKNSSTAERLAPPTPLVFWNRQITVFRSYNDNVSPTERAANATTRLRAIPISDSELLVSSTETSNGENRRALITVNGSFVFAILDKDLDPESEESLQAAVNNATTQLRVALEARATQRRWPEFLKAIGWSLLATVLLLTGLWMLVASGRRLLNRVNDTSKAKPSSLKFGDFDLKPILLNVNRVVLKSSIWAAALLMVYVWLAFILLRFSYSQPWGQQLAGFLINLFQQLGLGFLQSLPGIFTVVVIFLVTRLIARLISRFFTEVENGHLQSTWLHADTARATKRLVVVLIWVFAITVAYPHIPGSSTDAFKGVSVFVGLMVSLGSAGLVNQLMSGLVVVYSRALRPGEFVKIGQDAGTVTDVGMLSTKIVTPKDEEITIPNAVLVGTTTVNYSRRAGANGAVVGTTVTIGYDAPWRQVHEMLLHAAVETTGIRNDPLPRVWQKALSDFYVEYELVFNLDHPERRIQILSELYTHIQDAFNEQGVQIMSPHFQLQPEEKVFVPKSKWFTKVRG